MSWSIVQKEMSRRNNHVIFDVFGSMAHVMVLANVALQENHKSALLKCVAHTHTHTLKYILKLFLLNKISSKTSLNCVR